MTSNYNSQKKVYNASEVYLVFEVKNKSGIDFEIDYLNVYKIIGKNKRKSSFQKLQLKETHKQRMPLIVKDSRLVYLLPKFVLGDNEKLQIELQEQNGSRKVIMKN